MTAAMRCAVCGGEIVVRRAPRYTQQAMANGWPLVWETFTVCGCNAPVPPPYAPEEGDYNEETRDAYDEDRQNKTEADENRRYLQETR